MKMVSDLRMSIFTQNLDTNQKKLLEDVLKKTSSFLYFPFNDNDEVIDQSEDREVSIIFLMNWR